MGITGARGTIVRQYLTRSEVAQLFEVSPATVARWTRKGKLPFVLTLGGQRRYPRSQVTALLHGGGDEGGSDDEFDTA
jgi:excisionase family DNA binding protein